MPTGAASWRYRYQFKGKTEKISLGKYPLVTLKVARSKRDELAKAVIEGVSPAKQKQLEKFALANSTSVADFSERYFKEVIEKDRKDTKQLRRYLEKEIYPAFGARPSSTACGRVWGCKPHRDQRAVPEAGPLMARVLVNVMASDWSVHFIGPDGRTRIEPWLLLDSHDEVRAIPAMR